MGVVEEVYLTSFLEEIILYDSGLMIPKTITADLHHRPTTEATISRVS
ncbi:hypothetical protein HMPREF1144_1474 [Klebsiella sp. OBRC7]|nr:hypothetical protein HMPREF1144_1474 [Klebsiella sp. OBRC7]